MGAWIETLRLLAKTARTLWSPSSWGRGLKQGWGGFALPLPPPPQATLGGSLLNGSDIRRSRGRQNFRLLFCSDGLYDPYERTGPATALCSRTSSPGRSRPRAGAAASPPDSAISLEPRPSLPTHLQASGQDHLRGPAHRARRSQRRMGDRNYREFQQLTREIQKLTAYRASASRTGWPGRHRCGARPLETGAGAQPLRCPPRGAAVTASRPRHPGASLAVRESSVEEHARVLFPSHVDVGTEPYDCVGAT